MKATNSSKTKEQDDNASSIAPSVMVERSVTKGNGQYNNSTWDFG